MASHTDKRNDSTEFVEVRWKLPKRIYKKIKLYKTDNDLQTVENAGVILLDQVTTKIKVVNG